MVFLGECDMYTRVLSSIITFMFIKDELSLLWAMLCLVYHHGLFIVMHQTWGRTIGTIWFVFNWAVKKITGYSVYIGVYTTQVYRDYNKPLQGSLLNTQYFMECQQGLVHVAQLTIFLILLQSKGPWVYSLKSYKTLALKWWRTVPEKMIRPHVKTMISWPEKT